MFRLSLEQGHSLAVMLAVTAVALVLTLRFYGPTLRDLTRRRRLLLCGLRTFAIVLVVLLLFRPVFSLQTDVRQKRVVVLLLDASASMATTDDASGRSRFDLARARVTDWHGRLHQDFDLRLLTFAGSATPVARPDDLAGLQPTGEATSLVRALRAAGESAPRADVEAVFLLSDGVHNAAGDPVATARSLGVVVHAVGAGNSLRDSPSYRDVQVTGIECPPELVINNRARVTATVDSLGLAGRVVEVLLDEDGKRVGRAELTLTSAGAGQPVAFEFLPAAKGRHTYTARVPVLAEEKIDQNNQRSTSARVVDARIRVLYVEGALRAEYGAIVDRFLSKDPDVEFCALVQTRRNVFVQRTNISGLRLAAIPTEETVLEKFNVIVLGDLDSSHLRGRMEALVRRVRDGAGLVMLGGYNSLGPGGYGGSPLEAILPVLVGGPDVGQAPEPFLPVLTPEGRAHPIFAGIARFFPTKTGEPEAKGLPPLDGCVKVAGARPGATVLALHPGGGPVLAVQPAGKGLTAVFTGDTTRNWQQGPWALEQESPFLRFWGQLVRWLAARTDSVRGEAGVLAQTDRSWYEPDAPVALSAVVRDKEGEGVRQAQVAARIKKPFGQDDTLPLTAADAAGNYRAAYEPKRPGRYEITVTATWGDTQVEAEKLVIEVGRPNLEYDRLDLDDKTLARIAEAAGGRYAHVSTADRLIEDLDRKERRRRIYLEQRLYFPPLYWALVVGALALEWGLRKRYQLR